MGTIQGKKLQDADETIKTNFSSLSTSTTENRYTGPPLEYHFVDTQIIVHPQTNSFLRTPSLSSEDEGHYLLLEQSYTCGFKLLHFTRIPGALQRTGHLGSSILIHFQGIFARSPDTCRSVGCLELRVEKAWLQATCIQSGLLLSRCLHHMLNTSNVEEAVERGAQSGERLLCVGVTGQEDSLPANSSGGAPSSVVRVDLFFEMTSQLTAEQYRYTIASVPVKVTYRSQVMFRPLPQLFCDWQVTLTQHLRRGWRLVDIYIDIPTVSQFLDPKSQDFSPCSLDALWFFEKPVSCPEDSAQRYEGRVVEHCVMLQSHRAGTSAVVGWERAMREMGKAGWELACVVETHAIQCVGLTEVILKSLLFFQRPLPPHVGKGHSSPLKTGSRSSLSD